MRRERLGGSVLIAGAISSVVTMAFHPTGADVMHDLAGQGAVSAAVHGLALLSTPLLVYGLWVLTRLLGSKSPLAELALVVYGAGAIAVMLSLSVNGFLATTLMTRIAASTDTAQVVANGLLRYNADLGGFFARAYVFASAIAIALWSTEILRTRLVRTAAGYFGVVIALFTLVAVASGHLRLTLHGFTGIVAGEAVWLVMVGIELVRAKEIPTTQVGG